MSDQVTLSTVETRGKHRAHLLSILPEMVARLSWDRPAINLHQRDRLRSLLRHAKSRSRWHADRLSGVDVDSIELSDLSALPVMSKADLMDNWDDVVTVPGVTLEEVSAFVMTLGEGRYFRDSFHAVASGGTSGRTLMTLYSWEEFAEHMASISRAYAPLLARLFPAGGIQISAIGADSAQHISYALNETFGDPDAPVNKISAGLSDNLLCEALNTQQPDMLVAYPSALSRITSLSMMGKISIQPKLIVSVSEALAENLYKKLSKYWKCSIFDVWSTTESSGTFACDRENRCHVSEDMNIIEPSPDGHGVLLTNLYNLSIPLVRYHIDDRFEFAESPCSCGSSFTAVRRVHGRVWDVLVIGGVTIHEIVFMEALDKFAGIMDYQIAQSGSDIELKILSSAPIDVIFLSSLLTNRLKELGVVDPRLSVRAVDELQRTKTGKAIKLFRADEIRA